MKRALLLVFLLCQWEATKVVKKSTVGEQIREFQEYLRERNAFPKTIEEWKSGFKAFRERREQEL